MSSAELLKQADAIVASDSKKAEALYKGILNTKSSVNDDQQQQAALLRDQESALVNLGKLHRNKKFVCNRTSRHLLMVSM